MQGPGSEGRTRLTQGFLLPSWCITSLLVLFSSQAKRGAVPEFPDPEETSSRCLWMTVLLQLGVSGAPSRSPVRVTGRRGVRLFIR